MKRLSPWGMNTENEIYIKGRRHLYYDVAGLTQLADKRNIFIISPNGLAYKEGNLWGGKKQIKPGSTIVIPRRVELASNLEKVSAITEVVYQITLTLAGIDSLLRN